MRQIEQGLVMIARLVFRKDSPYIFVLDDQQEQITGVLPTETEALYNEIQALLAQGNYCDAEDLLFQRMDRSDLEVLEIGLDMYAWLNQRTDEDLEAHDLPRDEVYQGLKDLAGAYGLSVVM